jgi:hypothetical protein
MTKSKLKLTALFAVFALLGAWSVGSSRATSSPAATNTLPEVNINSELQTLNSFGDDLARLDKKRAGLIRRSSVSDTEFTSVKNDHDALRRRVSQLPNAIRSIIQKLKASGRWDTFDADLLASTKDEKFKASVAEFGGARRLFEDVASQLDRSDSADEILGSLDDVRKKVAAHAQEQFFEPRLPAAEFRLVAASYNPGEPMAKRSVKGDGKTSIRGGWVLYFGRLGCAFATIRYGATQFVHAFGSEESFEAAVMTSPASNNWACKCNDACGSATTFVRHSEKGSKAD